MAISSPVLLTSGNTRSALAVARSLYRRGVDVLALCVPPVAGYAAASRAVREVLPAPGASEDHEAFVAAVRDAARRYGAELVIPITDEDLVALDLYRTELRDVRLAMPSADALRQVLDKCANLRLAATLGVPVPRSFDLQHLGQLPQLIAALGWPIVLKRPGSPHDPRLPRFDFRVLVAHDVPELLAQLDRHCSAGPFPIVQEFVPGEAFNVVCMAVGGEIVAAHEYQSLRTYCGNGVLRRVVPAHPELLQHAHKLMAALHWDGVAHVGFFRQRDSGQVGYMEVNGRFWASTQGSIDAGWDFPWWTYRWFTRGERPSVPELRMGSQTVWRYGDFQALVARLDGGPSPTPGQEPGGLRAVLDFLAGFRPSIRSEIFRWTDPGPALVDARAALSGLSRLIQRSLRGRDRDALRNPATAPARAAGDAPVQIPSRAAATDAAAPAAARDRGAA